MVVQHNISGMNANRQLNMVTGTQAKSSEKLSSGYRINRAADDAAGLAISEKMRRQIRGLDQGLNNAQDGVSWCQIADGALDEVDNMLERVKELAVKASNETLTDDDRGYIDEEIKKISTEIDRIHTSASFNEIPIFDGGLNPNADSFVRDENGSIVITDPSGRKIEILMPFVDSNGDRVEAGSEAGGIGSPNSYADSEIAQFAQKAAASAIDKLTAAYPNLFAKASSGNNIQIGLDLSNVDGPGSVAAVAKMRMQGTSDSTAMMYTMQIDTSDYPIDAFPSMSDEKKADLAAVIAHEMTHLVMYDTLTSKMLGDNLPDWFVEGSAQTSSGDNEWVSNRLNPDSSDETIKSYMSQLSSMPYGAGYVATMYLGQLASESDVVNSTNIKSGLDKIMTSMAEGKSFSEAIAENTSYSDLSAFERGFANADEKALQFTKNLLVARGTDGAGSILGDLGQSESNLFGNVTGASVNSYKINTQYSEMGNAFGGAFDWDSIPPRGRTDTASVLYLQVGADNTEEDRIPLKRYSISVDQITNHAGFDTKTAINARNTLGVVETAATNVSKIRSYYGALQNRLEHTIRNLGNVVENTTSAESLIRDTDMASEMVKYSNNNILAQAGQSMLAQANQTNQGVLSLLQ